MSFELTRDVSEAAKIGLELRDSQQRLDLATRGSGLREEAEAAFANPAAIA